MRDLGDYIGLCDSLDMRNKGGQGIVEGTGLRTWVRGDPSTRDRAPGRACLGRELEGPFGASCLLSCPAACDPMLNLLYLTALASYQTYFTHFFPEAYLD